MPGSIHTLLGRVHEQVRLEAERDVEALYEFIDPVIRSGRECERGDEPDSTLSAIREFVRSIESAEVEEVEILEARKSSDRLGGRPAALVRSSIRYNRKPTTTEYRTLWVRDHEVWYSTALNRSCSPAAQHLSGSPLSTDNDVP